MAYGECVLEQFGEQEDAERSVAFGEAKEAAPAAMGNPLDEPLLV